MAITLPRMAFDITGYAYDASRKLNKNQKVCVVTTNADTTKLNAQYSKKYSPLYILFVINICEYDVFFLFIGIT